jgi:peptide/nickel transport system substrate-binding protein
MIRIVYGKAKNRIRRVRRNGGMVATAALAAALSVGTAACGGGDSAASGSASGAASTTLVVASAALPSTFTFDAASPAGYENLEFGVNTQAGLIRQEYVTDPGNSALLLQNLYQFQGVLASSWTVSPNHLTYTFRLKRNVKSAAGDPLTAADVVYSFQRKFNASTSITPYVQAPVITDPARQIKEINKYTVSFTVAKPGYGFTLLSLLANVTGYIYDSKLLKDHATKADPYAVQWSQSHPNIGFGAYNMTSLIPGTEMDLAANPNYPMAQPYYKKVIFRVSSDPGVRADAVANGNAQIAVQLLPSEQIGLDKNSSVRVYSFPSTNMMTMFTMNTTEPPFSNLLVRQAMAEAVPYQQIISNVYYGRALLTNSLLDPNLPGFIAAGLKYPAYDPAAAKKLLAKAGFPNGVSATVTISTAVPDVQAASIQIQSAAAAAGFKITLQQVPAAEMSAGITSRRWQAFMWRDMAISSAPQYELDLFFKAQDGAATAANSSGWVNSRYLNIVNAGAGLADPASSLANNLWNQAQLIAQQQVPQIYVARVQPLNAFSSGIVGYANRLDNDIDFSMLRPAS